MTPSLLPCSSGAEDACSPNISRGANSSRWTCMRPHMMLMWPVNYGMHTSSWSWGNGGQDVHGKTPGCTYFLSPGGERRGGWPAWRRPCWQFPSAPWDWCTPQASMTPMPTHRRLLRLTPASKQNEHGIECIRATPCPTWHGANWCGRSSTLPSVTSCSLEFVLKSRSCASHSSTKRLSVSNCSSVATAGSSSSVLDIKRNYLY